jgi:hypothetical protein
MALQGVVAAGEHQAACRAHRLLLRSRSATRQARGLLKWTLPELGYSAEQVVLVLGAMADMAQLVAGVHRSSSSEAASGSPRGRELEGEQPQVDAKLQ